MKQTTPYSPDINGVAERLNRIVIESTKAILADINLSKNFYGWRLHEHGCITQESV
jgi:hypothetical protein